MSWILPSYGNLHHFWGDFVVMTTSFAAAFSASTVRVMKKEFDTMNEVSLVIVLG